MMIYAFAECTLNACYVCTYMCLLFIIVSLENFTGCQTEVDHTWFIRWPQTAAGTVATQKCNRVDSVGEYHNDTLYI